MVVAINNDVGPHDKDSNRSEETLIGKLRESNDSLRQSFIDKTVPQAELIGLKVPDDKLKWNEKTNHYDFGDIDWEEFWNVVNGEDYVIKRRIEHHKKAHDEGEWVREAAVAYSEKLNKKGSVMSKSLILWEVLFKVK